MAKLPSELYVTVAYVDPERLKCANANCPRNGETRNRIDTAQLLATGDSGVHFRVRLYFCDECYPRYKTAIDKLPGIGSHYDPDCEFCNPSGEGR